MSFAQVIIPKSGSVIYFQMAISSSNASKSKETPERSQFLTNSEMPISTSSMYLVYYIITFTHLPTLILDLVYQPSFFFSIFLFLCNLPVRKDPLMLDW